jgi:hypothetical protein
MTVESGRRQRNGKAHEIALPDTDQSISFA